MNTYLMIYQCYIIHINPQFYNYMYKHIKYYTYYIFYYDDLFKFIINLEYKLY